MWPSWLPFLYPPPASAFVTAMSAVSLVLLANGGLSELRGKNVAYSKFWYVVAARGKQQRQQGGGTLLPSRDGMLVAYAPAFVVAAASFAVPGAVEGARAQLLSAALAGHFLKRLLEVLFVHRYSGNMPLATAVTISSSYLLGTATMIYAQHLKQAAPGDLVPLVVAASDGSQSREKVVVVEVTADADGEDEHAGVPQVDGRVRETAAQVLHVDHGDTVE